MLLLLSELNYSTGELSLRRNRRLKLNNIIENSIWLATPRTTTSTSPVGYVDIKALGVSNASRIS